MSNNFRTDVVGSLLRPAYLKEARAEYEAGKLHVDSADLAEKMTAQILGESE